MRYRGFKMFEDVSEAPQREGIRGLVRWHFGPPADLEDACQELQRVSTIFSTIGLISAVVGASRFGPLGMVDGGIVAVLALILRFSQSRIAAGLLLLFAALTLVLVPGFWHVIWLLFAIRGLQLSIAATKLKKERASLPSETALPPGQRTDNPYRIAESETKGP